MRERNSIEFRVYGENALFTDPITKLGGEKSTYLVPTYQALKGITESIYFRPTIVWVIDRVRVMNKIATESKGARPLKYADGGNDLAWYTYLCKPEYEVLAHFEWNLLRPDLESDRNENKHWDIAKRCVERGGRRDIFLGTRECQGYVEPCVYGERSSFYSGSGERELGCMFHSFDYPTETGGGELKKSLWYPVMNDGEIIFERPDALPPSRKQTVRNYSFKPIETSGAAGTEELWKELQEEGGR